VIANSGTAISQAALLESGAHVADLVHRWLAIIQADGDVNLVGFLSLGSMLEYVLALSPHHLSFATGLDEHELNDALQAALAMTMHASVDTVQ
jgi:hypothetical protein